MKWKLPAIRWSLRVLLYMITLCLGVLSIAVSYYGVLYIAISSMIYASAAVALALSSIYLYRDIQYGIQEHLRPSIEAKPLANRIMKDYEYRTVLTTYLSLGLNLIYALTNGWFGIKYHSIWFGSLSGYYMVLSSMRFILVQYDRKPSTKESNWRVYRVSGILLILLSIALGVAVIQMVYGGKTYSYPNLLIYAVAAYTFYKIILSVINMIKAGKLKAPIVMAIRNIGHADALVSLLALQTAMFEAFGYSETINKAWMNSFTGGIACLSVFVIGLSMILKARKRHI